MVALAVVWTATVLDLAVSCLADIPSSFEALWLLLIVAEKSMRCGMGRR